MRFALVENEQRIGQAARNIRSFWSAETLTHGGTAPSEAELTSAAYLAKRPFV